MGSQQCRDCPRETTTRGEGKVEADKPRHGRPVLSHCMRKRHQPVQFPGGKSSKQFRLIARKTAKADLDPFACRHVGELLEQHGYTSKAAMLAILNEILPERNPRWNADKQEWEIDPLWADET